MIYYINNLILTIRETPNEAYITVFVSEIGFFVGGLFLFNNNLNTSGVKRIMQGWLQLHRELMDKAIWKTSTPEQKTILITLLMMANHKESEWEWRGERFHIQPGQCITSLVGIAERAGKGISTQNVRTALKRFEKYGFLKDDPTNKNRLITIVNWGFYQSLGCQTNKLSNKRLTGDQQNLNNQQTPNKNDKNFKNALKEDDRESRILNLLTQNNLIESEKIPLTIMEDINHIIYHSGFDDPYSMIDEAIKDSARGNGRTWKYVYNKLNLWRKQEIKNAADLEKQIQQPNNLVPFNQKSPRNKQEAEAILDKYM